MTFAERLEGKTSSEGGKEVVCRTPGPGEGLGRGQHLAVCLRPWGFSHCPRLLLGHSFPSHAWGTKRLSRGSSKGGLALVKVRGVWLRRPTLHGLPCLHLWAVAPRVHSCIPTCSMVPSGPVEWRTG